MSSSSSTVEQAPECIRLLQKLRAVRQFTSKPLPENVLKDILEVARWSGSAGNRQPWELVVIRSPETLRTLAAVPGATAGHLATAAAGIAIVMPGDKPELDAFDEARLAERIMLAAAAHGVSSSIGWFTGHGSEEAKRLLGIPRERLLRTAVSFGYADEAARRGRASGPAFSRKPLSELVRQERY